MKCKDCKHWGEHPRDACEPELLRIYGEAFAEKYVEGGPPPPHRMCGRVLHAFDHSRAAAPILALARDDLAYMMDASGYMADLWSGPEFGCELGEPRDEASEQEASE